MQLVAFLFDFIMHIDVHLGQIITDYGTLTYAILFLIIFVETGLVFTPFLPGDSLLFAAGAFAALNTLNIYVVLVLLIIAAVLGDTVNYWIGHFFGARIIAHPRMPINKKHIEETERFFEKHGGITIILARFMPFIRTFAPFVAGIGRMSYGRFLTYNVVGGVLWVAIASLAGFFFGNIPFVRDNFSMVIIGIIVISLLPIGVQFVRSRLKAAAQ